ncbi:histidinol-phosphate aminotransferase [Legionella quinlivanii]|uniref:Histidinol-phosphate aminotransferase n=1 Tax=Legionella quinlivanii TaxID=45073 RepID=A0A0W0XL47_9GAMM|nr:histidinol-phosphate transaminase [Legionella quinlivanii]KTD45335.1 histidinol-phosphate aminotransferase [Legionella quinlivanii]MCW8451388.1 histidinol-phosphate transaminase [Legionella quinlivanii]STY10409.1 histidinol-phosphate aminotransferase [Legionella quinlivanii]
MACDFFSLPHPGIKTLNPYVPGKSIEELTRELGIENIIKLASNENPLGCSPHVRDVLEKLSNTTIATYPSPGIHPLRKELANHLGIEEAMLTLSNGSDLLFNTVMVAFALHSGKKILTHQHAFISYQIQAQTLGIPTSICPALNEWEVNIDGLIERASINTALIFIANPNNPTGLLLDLKEIERLMASIPSSTIVVLDEAYYEFAYSARQPGALQFLNQYPNLIITRTFSKAYGLAGLRLGYAIAHPDIIQLLLRVQLPFAVNQVAMQAGIEALADQSFVAETLSVNAQGMEQLAAGFSDLGLPCLPSACNFLTIDCKQNALPVYQSLLEHGIIVRPLVPYALPNHLRISIGTKEQNARLLATLPTCLSANKETL